MKRRISSSSTLVYHSMSLTSLLDTLMFVLLRQLMHHLCAIFIIVTLTMQCISLKRSPEIRVCNGWTQTTLTLWKNNVLISKLSLFYPSRNLQTELLAHNSQLPSGQQTHLKRKYVSSGLLLSQHTAHLACAQRPHSEHE